MRYCVKPASVHKHGREQESLLVGSHMPRAPPREMLSSHFTPGDHTLGIHTPLLQSCVQTTQPRLVMIHERSSHIPLNTLPIRLTYFVSARRV